MIFHILPARPGGCPARGRLPGERAADLAVLAHPDDAVQLDGVVAEQRPHQVSAVPVRPAFNSTRTGRSTTRNTNTAVLFARVTSSGSCPTATS
jgi:hypothetical protein